MASSISIAAAQSCWGEALSNQHHVGSMGCILVMAQYVESIGNNDLTILLDEYFSSNLTISNSDPDRLLTTQSISLPLFPNLADHTQFLALLPSSFTHREESSIISRKFIDKSNETSLLTKREGRDMSTTMDMHSRLSVSAREIRRDFVSYLTSDGSDLVETVNRDAAKFEGAKQYISEFFMACAECKSQEAEIEQMVEDVCQDLRQECKQSHDVHHYNHRVRTEQQLVLQFLAGLGTILVAADDGDDDADGSDGDVRRIANETFGQDEIPDDPLEEYIIESLPRICTKEGDCSICMTDLAPSSPETKDAEIKDSIIMLPCMHKYHEGCIVEWFKTRPLCPICRQDVRQAIVKGQELISNEPSSSNV